MATRLEAIHASQFSTFLFAIHHMAVKAEEDTRASSQTVLLLVKCDNKKRMLNQETRKSAKPSNQSFFEQNEMG